MKLHLPVFLRKSLLSCLSAFIVCTVGSGAAWAEAQNLTFEGGTLTWDAQSESFTDESDAATAFAEGDNVSFTGESNVALGQDITAGTVAIEQGAAVAIDLDVFELNVDRIELSGSLDVGDSLSIGKGASLAMTDAGAVLDSNLVLGEEGVLSVTGAGGSLNGNSLVLQEGASLILTGAVISRETTDVNHDGELSLIVTPTGDGKTYTLLTGVSELVDKYGNSLTVGSYSTDELFDSSLPGSGFWTGGTLVYASDGALTLVRHNETVKDALDVTTRQTGSVDYSYYAGISFKNLTTNGSNALGDAICGDNGSTITLSGNGSVTFSGNTASSSDAYAYGGAIYGGGNSTITLSGNGSVTFSGNTASSSDSSACGGAIDGHTITLSDNGSVTFSGNTASSSDDDSDDYAYGGAISGGTITLSDNGSVTFSGNTASCSSYAAGGVIYGYDGSTITLSDNGSVTFSGNTASSSDDDADDFAYGGAISGASNSTITLSGNGSLTFSGNTASSSSSSSDAYGGAICGHTITLSDNGSVTFSGNTASSSSDAHFNSAHGGAIYGDNYGDSSTTITLSNNGSVVFEGNTASSSSSSPSGGAIYGGEGSTITLSDNGSVTFSGNTARDGGAIYTQGDLSIRNNDSVEFYQNAEVVNGTYRLRSIYAYGGSGDEISLSAAAGKSITFRDSIYIGEGSSFKLNEAYEGKAQLGDIIFTGATTVDDLYTVKDNVAGTEEEIRLSRTTEVNALTNLYGGRLRVEDGAIYQGQGITAHAGSDATVLVKDATLSHEGYDLTFNVGTTLELTGANTITGNVQMLEGSTMRLKDATVNGAEIPLSFNAGTTLELAGANSITGNLNLLDGSTLHIDFAGNEFTTNLNGSPLALTGDAFLRLTGAGNGDGKTYTLFTGVSGLLDAQGNAISLDSSNNAASLYFDATQPGTGFWANGTLQLNNGALQMVLHNEAVKEAITVTTPQMNPAAYQYYAGVRFENISNTSTNADVYGGAIYGETDSIITLNNNGSVTFSGNTAFGGSSYAYGGAICGDIIELNNNGRVDFSNNSCGDWDGYGGAIYGRSIILIGNGSVSFSGNLAVGLGNDIGGAIVGDNIELIGNGSVSFCGNFARDLGGAIYGNTITISNNGSVEFRENSADSGYYSAPGGAICGDGVITLSNNGSVVFEGNVSFAINPEGGAINGETIELSGNESVEFSRNAASDLHDASHCRGGAIYGDVTLSNNGSVVFEGNTSSATNDSSSAYGGAICGGNWLSCQIRLNNNGGVVFEGNTASGSSSALGGAIYAGKHNLSICNNDSVLFEKNTEITDGVYRLRSIVGGGDGSVIFLSAAAGKSIEFRDSVYIGSDSTLNLNEDYTYLDEEGVSVTVEQKGDIVFTGATTVDDLYTVKGNVAGTEEEILLSRTTEVYTMTNLYGGRLRVEDGAIYQGRGITAHAGSEATVQVKDATLSHEGYDLTFNAGTTLALAGANSITGNLNFLEGSTLHIDFAGNEFTTNLNGSTLELTGDAFLRLTSAGKGDGKTYTLLTGVSGLVDAEGNAITLDSTNNAISNYFDADRPGTGFWSNGTLVLNDGTLQLVLHDQAVKEAVTITTRQTRSVDYSYYAGISFKNLTTNGSSAEGGAICGDSDSTITLSNNGSVTISGNTASGSYTYGGAISGGDYSTITLSNNGSVTFSGNTASASLSDADIAAGYNSSQVCGGAIYIHGGSITLSNNGSVVFEGNTATSSSSSADAYGGAIAGMECGITLSDNGSVIFEGNALLSSGSQRATASGGAICGTCWIVLSDNERVTFSGNTVSGSSSVYGGAIYATWKNLSIQNNDLVEFYQNVEVEDGVYRLRSIYADDYLDEVSLSAAEGKSITFRDSIYIGSGSTVKLNEAYEGMSQQGDIIFTGATTVDDLYAVKGNVAGTESEILNSRTTEVNALTNLYGGRLRVEDGAIYQGLGITAHAGSDATVLVKDATLSHSGYDLTFNAGTTLELAGSNTITGNVQMLEGSTLRFDFGADAVSSLTGSLSFEDAATLQVAGYGAGTHELLRLNGSTVSGWDALSFTDGAGVSIDAADFVMWEDSLFYRNGEAMNLIWTNAAGDALWNNQSLNWVADGTPYAVSVLQNVIFTAGGNETITMVGNQVVESLTVQQGGQYVLNGNADGTSLTVREGVLLEGNTALTVRGNLEASAINAQGSLEVTGNLAVAGQLTAGSLTLSDATATHTIGGNVTLSGAATVAGTLEVSGSFNSGAVQVKKLMADGTVSTGAISSSDNSLTATGNMTTGAVTGDRNELTSTGGYVLLRNNAALNGSSNKLNAAHVVQVGTITGDGNELVAGKHVDINGSLNGDENSITCNATVNTTDNAIDISGTIGSATNTADDNALYAVRGNIRTGAITGSGNTLTAQDGNITTGAITGNDNVLSAVNGVVTAGAIAGTGNVVTAKSLQAAGMEGVSLTLTDATATNRIGGNVTLSGAATVAGELTVNGSFNSATLQVKSLTADGSITTGKLTGDSATLTALNGNVELTNEHESLNGNSNVITATGGDVRLTDDMTGSRNIITAKAVDGVGGSILRGNGRALWASIAGQHNELTADGRIELESINQGNNTLIAGGAIVNDGGTISINSINGSTNTLTATNGSIRVGNIGNAAKSDNNRLTAAGHVYVQGKLTGDGNYLESNKAPGDGNSISIWNGINGSGNRILANAGNIAMGGGDLTGDNNTLTSVNGNVSVRNVSGSGNTLSAGGNISLGSVTGDYNTLTAGGRITAAAISGAGNAVTAGMLTTTGGLQGSTLTLTNGDASNSIGGNVALSGAATVAGALQVTGALAAEGTVSLASTAEITGDMSAAALVLNAGASLDVGGSLSAAQVTLNNLSTTAPTLTVGSFAAGDTIFTLDGASLNALNLGHGESVVIARADGAIGSGFNAWLGAGSTSLDAAVYRYDISVSGADVLVSMDYANWGTRVWYEGAWVGKDGWSEYMIAGYDAVNGVETVDLGGESIQTTNLFLAQEDSTSTSVLSNGSIEATCTEIVEGNLTIAEDASLDSDELRAVGHDILLQGELIVNNGSIGTLSGTTGTLVIGGEVSVDSNVTLGILDNSGTLDIGSHKLNVAAVVSNGGNVTAGEVVVHNRYGNPAEFDTLVADKVTVTNTSSKYPDYLSVGGGSVIGELVADKLEVREGTATLGSTAKQTEQELQSIALQKGADLVLQGQTSLSVTDSVAMTAGSEVQIQSGSTLQNGAVALSAAPGTAAAQLSSKTGGNLVMMQQAVGLCIQDVLLVNTCISAAEGTEVMLSGVEGSENVHLQGGADFSLTFANNKANVGMAVIENSSPVTGITLSAGSTLTLVMDPTNNDFRDYSLVINMSGFEYEGGSLAATGGITDLNAAGIYLGGWLGELLAGQGVVQEGVGNLESPEVPGGSMPTVSYTYSTDNNVGMIISINGLSVPEPTTTTLSLLALTALAARRRRR